MFCEKFSWDQKQKDAVKDRIPEKEINFIRDQRNERKMMMLGVDVGHVKALKERATHLPQAIEGWSEAIQPQSNSGSTLIGDSCAMLMTNTRLRKRTAAMMTAAPIMHESGDEESDLEQSWNQSRLRYRLFSQTNYWRKKICKS